MEKENSMDLSTKYQKLASEYAKIRAQGNVLKKAVLDEQAKTVKLKDELQVKDQSLRKIEQEMDSITFRNTQLEKRVGFLQDELATLTNTVKGKKIGGKKKDKESASEAANITSGEAIAFDFELLSKIDENIQLHKQISDLEENFRREVTDLKSQLEEKECSESRIKQQTLDHLEAEKMSLTHSLQSALDELDAYRDQVEQLQEKIRSLSTFPLPASNSLHSHANNSLTPHHSDGLIKQDSLGSGGHEDSSNADVFDRLIKSEQSKEHWMIEYQLYKMKYSKTLKRLDEAKSILKSLGKENLLNDEMTPSIEMSQSFTTLVGKMEVIGTENPEIRGLCEQKSVNQYLICRINDLIALLQLANSKAITFHLECVSLENLLALNVQRRLDVEEKYTVAFDELQLTKQNYESQLSTMTEHIATLNDKMLTQKDNIDDLTFALSNKAPAKSAKK